MSVIIPVENEIEMVPKLKLIIDGTREIVWGENRDDWKIISPDKFDIPFVFNMNEWGHVVMIKYKPTGGIYLAADLRYTKENRGESLYENIEKEVNFDKIEPDKNAEFKISMCAICDKEYWHYFPPCYPGLVCWDCEYKAVDEKGNKPSHDSWKDDGSNPLFIDGVKCWRRYRFGGYITMLYSAWDKIWK